jgi:hypothetical protein
VDVEQVREESGRLLGDVKASGQAGAPAGTVREGVKMDTACRLALQALAGC